MIKNKIIAAILAVLTFIVGSVLLTVIIFYALGYPLSSIPQNQPFVFLAILISAFLASRVYGGGGTERAAKATKYLNETLGLKLNEKDVWKALRAVEHMPPYAIKKYITLNINAVDEFEVRIKDYTDKLSEEELLTIKRIIEMPVPELQNILNNLYLETKLEQFKVLSEPEAKPLIELNVKELKKILFNE
ncbi:hypothetical protein [Methanobacterium sp.]|uniref:hypothetical protein n=1 Tax=Methanobacterium sp. TaxID=2164 RepID=UPI003C7295BB